MYTHIGIQYNPHICAYMYVCVWKFPKSLVCNNLYVMWMSIVDEHMNCHIDDCIHTYLYLYINSFDGFITFTPRFHIIWFHNPYFLRACLLWKLYSSLVALGCMCVCLFVWYIHTYISVIIPTKNLGWLYPWVRFLKTIEILCKSNGEHYNNVCEKKVFPIVIVTFTFFFVKLCPTDMIFYFFSSLFSVLLRMS